MKIIIIKALRLRRNAAKKHLPFTPPASPFASELSLKP